MVNRFKVSLQIHQLHLPMGTDSQNPSTMVYDSSENDQISTPHVAYMLEEM